MSDDYILGHVIVIGFGFLINNFLWAVLTFNLVTHALRVGS